MTSDLLRTTAWHHMAQLILVRDEYRCQIRGPKCRGYATEVDHVVSRADGGPVFDPANLRASCKRCNSGRSADRTNAMRRYRTSVPDYDVRL